MLNEHFSKEKAQSNGRRRYQRLPPIEVDQILHEYQDPGMTLKVIGYKHGISMARVTWLARRGGLPLRGRGRKASTVPSDRHLEILEAVGHATMAEVAGRYGCSKQRIFWIVDRWRDWMARDGRAAVNSNPAPKPRVQLPKKPARELIVSFRLAPAEANVVLAALDSSGLRRSMSLAAGARALLLMLVGPIRAFALAGQIVYENHELTNKDGIVNGTPK